MSNKNFKKGLVPIGGEFQVNTHVPDYPNILYQLCSELVSLADGGYFALWSVRDNGKSSIYGQKVSSTYQKMGNQILISDFCTFTHATEPIHTEPLINTEIP